MIGKKEIVGQKNNKKISIVYEKKNFKTFLLAQLADPPSPPPQLVLYNVTLHFFCPKTVIR